MSRKRALSDSHSETLSPCESHVDFGPQCRLACTDIMTASRDEDDVNFLED